MNNKGKLYLVILAACFLGLSRQESRAQLLTITPHDLLPEQKVVVDGKEVVQWKTDWDEARKSALQGDFDTAVERYKGLLILKSNLEEARWELARLMMYLKRWDEAAKLLELLIESETDRILYINSLGKVMWEMGQYARAVDLFKRVNEKNPSDQTALAGLVEGLTRLDRKSEAIPYLEQLTRQQPTNRGVRRYLAFLLYETGNYEKARAHFTILSRNEDVEFDVLYKTARTYEFLGLEQQASTYWERVLTREPERIEAHIYLAAYYEKTGQLDRSLAHLHALLTIRPDDAAIHARIGEIYEKTEESDKALAHYEKYLAEHPDDQEISRRIADIGTTKGRTPPGREPPVYDQEQTADLHEALDVLDKETSSQDATLLYRQLLRISPGDDRALAALANDLTAMRAAEGNEVMLEFLASIVADDVSIYRNMADMLQRLGREEELLAVLQKIHELDPGDNFTTRDLAVLSLNRGELSLSSRYFAELSDAECWNIPCLEARAALAEKLDLPARRLKDYEALLELQPERYELRLATIGLAADMGLLDTALFHAGYLQNFPPGNENLELKIRLADAYREAGYLSRAVERYRNIIEQAPGESPAAAGHFRIRSRLGIAESYEKLGLVYEAEQALRAALVAEENRIPILEALFHLFLYSGRIAEAEIWLQAIERETKEANKDILPAYPHWKKDFLRAEMHEAAGDYDPALDLYRRAETLASRLEGSSEVPNISGDGASLFLIRKHMVACLLRTGKYAEAEELVLLQLNGHTGEPELQVLLEQLYRAWGKEADAAMVAQEARLYAEKDFGRQLALAKLYKKHGGTAAQHAAAEKAGASGGESLAPKLLLVEARIKQGDYFTALELLEQFLWNYPENTWFLSSQAEILAKVGNFREALAVTEMILAEDPQRWDMVLLRARIFWETNRWNDSVSLYESVNAPPVEKALEKKIQELQLAVDQSPSTTSWWEAITFSEGALLNISEVIMAPQHAVDFSAGGQAANAIAAEYYAAYRWQDRFGKEVSVRRSVMRREYYHAANKLEKVIEEYGDNDFLLYDLAGLYSRLERLGDETALYRKLAGRNAVFPGLSEAVQRNNLKRRPQAYLGYRMQEDDGWQGYKAVRQEMVLGGGKYYQTTNREWNLDFARINYESTNDEQDLTGWRALLSYDTKFSQALGVSVGAGFEKLEGGFDDVPLYYGSLTGKVADEMRAVFSIRQDIVADTIASLKRSIKRRDYKVELMFDLFPRLLIGGYYDYVDYSDANWTNNYTFWASYIVMPEPTLLKVSYNFDFYDSSEGQRPGVPSDDGFAPDDHPYWSPQNYWITRFLFYFKYQLSNDTLARGVPSYYTIEYSLGYDSNDNDLHEVKGILSVEIAKNYTLNISYGYVDLDIYHHDEAFLSLMYRF